MIYEGLCGDCLRVVLTEYEAAVQGNVLCECGGEVCPCSSCEECIQLLREGHTSAGILACQQDVENWTERDGTTAQKAGEE